MSELKKSYEKLLKGNQEWVKEKIDMDSSYFENLAKGQSPDYLWIGCADSRVPDNEITGSNPGDIFVHRNIANLVVHTDTNMLSVLQYAVEALHVKHIIVCGHYGCGGVLAAMDRSDKGLVNHWLTNIKEVIYKNKTELQAIADEKERGNRLVELNVIQQVQNLAKTSMVQKAWRNRELEIHGWVFDLHTGKIKDLDAKYDELEDLDDVFKFTMPAYQ
ncbi:MAG: carbonic anhydrase [Opitutaceae bacterium]|nr:carbonic anhydrase [Cytophagales bacterium]